MLIFFIQHITVSTQCRRWHTGRNRMKLVPDRWKREKCGNKREASCGNLILDHELHTKAKNGLVCEASSAPFKMSPRSWCDLFSVSGLMEPGGFAWHDSKKQDPKVTL